MNIDRQQTVDAAHDRITPGEYAAVNGTIAHRDHPFGIRRGIVGAFQRFAHVFRDWAGDQQHVGVSRRRDETQAKAFKIIKGIVESVDFE
jgi:hypothetical protein